MMMASRNDIKDRLMHNESPFPSKDKVLSYTIPVDDHNEPLLFCTSSSDSSSGSGGTCSAKNSANGGHNQDNESLNFIGPDDDPCTGRDSLASFLDEGLGTSLDGVDEVTSPIFSSLARNDSGEEVLCWKARIDDDDGGPSGTIPLVTVSIGGVAGTGCSATTAVGQHRISCGSPKYILGDCDSSDEKSQEGPGGTIKLYCGEVDAQNEGVQQGSSSNSGSGSSKKGSGQQHRSKNMPLGRQGPQKCSICDKAFSNASALTKHKLTHSDERRHACATCGKAFKRQDHLNGHMLTHRNKKPFECKSKGCGKSYCDARSLRRHVESRHGHEVLESMNLASHKHTSKKHKSHGKLHQEPQQEVVQFAPVKLEYPEGKGGEEEVLEAKPQMQVAVVEAKMDKSVEKVAPVPAPPPPTVDKGSSGESAAIPTFSLPREGVPIVVKREKISVFDFDESMEDSMAQPYNAGPTFPPTGVAPQPPPPASASTSTLDKVAPPPPVLKINGFGDPTKLGQIPDIKLIQEWARRLGDSKVALFVSSSPATGGGSSITQFSGPLQLAGGNVTTSGPSHAFIPTSENGETEGSKKKEVSKDNNHGTPLQTVSVSVRALIEEKIRERRNNLLKLAAAAAAEKAAKEQGGGTAPPTESTSTSPSHDKPKPDKGKFSENRKTHSANVAQPQLPLQDSSSATNSLTQNQNQANKLNPNPELITSEKDRNCDHLINDNCRSNNSKLAKANCKPAPLTINMNGTGAVAVNLDGSGSFQDPVNLLMGSGIGSGMNIGVQQGSTSNTNGLLPPQLIPTATNHTPELTTFPFQVLEKSNFSSLQDYVLSPDQQSCPTFQIIYVDANGESIPLAVSQGSLGKASEFLPVPVSVPNSKISSMPILGSFCEGGSDQSSLKGVKDALMGCPSSTQCLEDPCTPLWEWKSSVSSDNTDNSFGIPQDFFGSSSSDTQMESKDPVAAGRGYCYTPILSPNSSFCLTPGPDSPFEVSNQNPSLSFLCPSPGLGDGPIFSYSNVPSLANPASEEPIFSPDPPTSQPTPMNISSPLMEQQKCFQYQPQQQPQVISISQPKLQSSVFIDEFGTSQCAQSKDGGMTMSQNAPIQSNFMAEQPQPPQLKPETHLVDSLPPITTFPTMLNNTTALAENSFIGSNLIYQCPIDSILGSNLMQQQQTFIPFEVFTSSPIPSSVTDKWVRGNTGKPRKIHVGKDYQAEIPQRVEPPKGKGRRGRSMDEKLWDPHVMHSCSIEEVDNYLEFACCSAVPGGGMNKEYALHLLMLCKGNIREAILRLMEKQPTLPSKLKSYSYTECQRWSSEEIISFQISLFQVGKDFPRISKSIGTKCSEEVVSFYYFWKKVCPSQYHVMKQIWKGRLEHQQLQLQQNSNLLEIISNSNNNNSSNTNGLANFGMGSGI